MAVAFFPIPGAVPAPPRDPPCKTSTPHSPATSPSSSPASSAASDDERGAADREPPLRIICANCGRYSSGAFHLSHCAGDAGRADADGPAHAHPPVCSAECYWTVEFGGVKADGPAARRARRARQKQRALAKEAEASSRAALAEYGSPSLLGAVQNIKREDVTRWGTLDRTNSGSASVADETDPVGDAGHALFNFHQQSGFGISAGPARPIPMTGSTPSLRCS